MQDDRQLKSSSAEPAQPGPEHHDARGRFTAANPGNKKAPGRPKGRPNFWTELKRAVRRYRTPGGKKFFEAIVDKAIVDRSGTLGKTLLDKFFEDATIPKGIDLTMIQGAGAIEDAVKDLAAKREERRKLDGKPRLEFDEEDEP